MATIQEIIHASRQTENYLTSISRLIPPASTIGCRSLIPESQALQRLCLPATPAAAHWLAARVPSVGKVNGVDHYDPGVIDLLGHAITLAETQPPAPHPYPLNHEKTNCARHVERRNQSKPPEHLEG